ncbi:hypothetical protein B0T24DRAFT_664752 [Lasiosphaeria ovina]|uniref:Uncharacterized protein n=1 Tax=Lasiosphaeria ovina TaxID=92902 RepID=A0AAE0KEZ9_9PEZI|nr:hypothetical protein B0T24DRAFT_664752 [Lasiosphaeria ovina]
MSRNRREPRPYAGPNYSVSDSDATASDSWALVMAHPGDHVGGSTASNGRASSTRASSTRAMAVAHRGGHVNGSTASYTSAYNTRDTMSTRRENRVNGYTNPISPPNQQQEPAPASFSTPTTSSSDANDALYRATISRRLAMRQLIVNADATMKDDLEYEAKVYNALVDLATAWRDKFYRDVDKLIWANCRPGDEFRYENDLVPQYGKGLPRIITAEKGEDFNRAINKAVEIYMKDAKLKDS